MFCGNCGHRLSDALKYCPYCGKPVSGEGKSAEKENTHAPNAEMQKPKLAAALKAHRISRRSTAVCSISCILGVLTVFLVYQWIITSENRKAGQSRSFSSDVLVTARPDPTPELSNVFSGDPSPEPTKTAEPTPLPSVEAGPQDGAAETPASEEPHETSKPERPEKSADLSVQPEMWVEEINAPCFITQSEHGLILRAGPGTNYDRLSGKPTIPYATEILGIGFTDGIDNWFVTEYKGQVGWVSASYTRLNDGNLPVSIQDAQAELVEPDEWIDEAEQPHCITQSEHGLIMRKGPGTDYDRVTGETTIPYHTEVVCVGYNRENDEWFVTEYKGQFGWVSSSYVK